MENENNNTFELADIKYFTYDDYDEGVEVTVKEYVYDEYDADGNWLGQSSDYEYYNFAPLSYNPLD